MKKVLPTLALLFLLAACGGGTPADPSPAPSATSLSAQEMAQAILKAGTFSETLEEVEPQVAYSLYGMEPSDVLDCAVSLSTGATAEECAVLIMKDEDAAKTALTALQTRIADQKEALADYQPAELAKLDKALTGTLPAAEGTLIYLVVAESTEGVLDAIQS